VCLIPESLCSIPNSCVDEIQLGGIITLDIRYSVMLYLISSVIMPQKRYCPIHCIFPHN
jgi:hypothetical protein